MYVHQANDQYRLMDGARLAVQWCSKYTNVFHHKYVLSMRFKDTLTMYAYAIVDVCSSRKLLHMLFRTFFNSRKKWQISV